MMFFIGNKKKYISNKLLATFIFDIDSKQREKYKNTSWEMKKQGKNIEQGQWNNIRRKLERKWERLKNIIENAARGKK